MLEDFRLAGLASGRPSQAMSQYEYHEFQAVDRRLTEPEMHQLRGCSSRAQITPTSFTNEYHFGSFKGDEDLWMEKYFDGYIYNSNLPP